MLTSILLAGYYIPLMGPRAYSVGIIKTEEDLDQGMTRAVGYVDRTGFENLVFDVLDLETFRLAPRDYIERLKKQVYESWISDNPDKLVVEGDNGRDEIGTWYDGPPEELGESAGL